MNKRWILPHTEIPKLYLFSCHVTNSRKVLYLMYSMSENIQPAIYINKMMNIYDCFGYDIKIISISINSYDSCQHWNQIKSNSKASIITINPARLGNLCTNQCYTNSNLIIKTSPIGSFWSYEPIKQITVTPMGMSRTVDKNCFQTFSSKRFHWVLLLPQAKGDRVLYNSHHTWPPQQRYFTFIQQ